MIETHYVSGIPIRVIEAMPEGILGVGGREYFTLFWQGAEIARIRKYEPPRFKFVWTGDSYLVSTDYTLPAGAVVLR